MMSRLQAARRLMLVQMLQGARGLVFLPSPGSLPRWAMILRLRAVKMQMLMLVQMLLG
jgi:hypothetical protein